MHALRSRLGDEDAISLVEIMVSLFILTVGILAIASVAGVSVRDLRRSERLHVASAAATEVLETVRGLEYANIGIDSGTCDGAATFDADGDLTTAEPVVTGIIGNTEAPYFDTLDGGVEISTCITWFDDPVIAGSDDAKRVTVVGRWNGERVIVRSGMVSG